MTGACTSWEREHRANLRASGGGLLGSNTFTCEPTHWELPNTGPKGSSIPQWNRGRIFRHSRVRSGALPRRPLQFSHFWCAALQFSKRPVLVASSTMSVRSRSWIMEPQAIVTGNHPLVAKLRALLQNESIVQRGAFYMGARGLSQEFPPRRLSPAQGCHIGRRPRRRCRPPAGAACARAPWHLRS